MTDSWETARQELGDFCSQLGAGTPTPGAGAAAAVAGALAAALVSMVAGLTLGREKYADVQPEMQRLFALGRAEAQALLACADADVEAFNKVMAAHSLPRGTPEEEAVRRHSVAAALQEAAEAPRCTMEHADVVMRAAAEVGQLGNRNARPDAEVAYLLARAACEGALLIGSANVAICDRGDDNLLGSCAAQELERKEITPKGDRASLAKWPATTCKNQR